MREGEGGFTLVELVIAVAIATVLLVAGGAWMNSMHPGALRGATNDFDAALAAARQLAATSGNGATIAFLPRPNAVPGFVLRVYSGRPTKANAVIGTTIRSVMSDVTVREATFGNPPFAIFLSSAGYPTGKASYPSVDASGNASFPVVASQPPCPVGGIVLTFRSPQGATQTRSLQCNVVASGTAAPDASPTPNAPHITPTSMVAHWTSDRGGGLRFKVAEFGYTEPFSKAATACDAIATFAANPVTPSTAANPDEPIANFELYPIPGSPGSCTVAVQDAYGQAVHASVQIMGDLTWGNPKPSLSMQVNDVLNLSFSKTYDGEPLQLQAGGACGGLVTATKGAVSSAGGPTTTNTAQLLVTAVAPGSCTLIVGDQYGEPTVSIPINVKAKQQFATWPQNINLGVSNGAIATTPSATIGCYAQATMSDGVTPDPMPAAIRAWANGNRIYVDATGCFTNALGTPVPATNNTVGGVIYEPGGNSESFSVWEAQDTCGSLETGWFPGSTGVASARLIRPGAGRVNCTMGLADGTTQQTSAIDKGLVSVSVSACAHTQKLNVAGWCVMPAFSDQGPPAAPDCTSGTGGPGDAGDRWFILPAGDIVFTTDGNGNLIATRAAPGTVIVDVEYGYYSGFPCPARWHSKGVVYGPFTFE